MIQLELFESKTSTAQERREQTRQLQDKPGACAKRGKSRKFHALYDRIYRMDVLWTAWERVRSNGGSDGVDGGTVEGIEKQGVETFLREIQYLLKEGRYYPQAVRRHFIPKGDGGQRPLSIPTVRDRVVQRAAKLILEPIFEMDFQECSYGFRPKKNALGALEQIRVLANQGYHYVLDTDIEKFFDSVNHKVLLKFEFLGHYLRKVPSYRFKGKFFLNRWPSQKSLNRIREKIRAVVHRSRFGVKNIRELIPALNRILRGWVNYFRWENANRQFLKIQSYLQRRLALFEAKRHQRRSPYRLQRYNYDWFCSLGLIPILGSIRYPNPGLVLAKAHAR